MRHSTEEAVPAVPNAAEREFDWYVGIDGGGATHQVCVLDAAGRAAGERAVAHAGAELATLAARLHEWAGPSLARVAVGVESRHAGPVALCLEHGAAVFAINPKQLERFRERASAAGAKDDRRDAYTAASALRTDRGAFHRVRLEDAQLVAIRELSRMGDELREEAARLSNQLRAPLERYFPHPAPAAPGAGRRRAVALGAAHRGADAGGRGPAVGAAVGARPPRAPDPTDQWGRAAGSAPSARAAGGARDGRGGE